MPLVSHPPSDEHGLVAATVSHGERALKCLPHSKNDGERMQAGRRGRGWQFVHSDQHDPGRTIFDGLDWARRLFCAHRARGPIVICPNRVVLPVGVRALGVFAIANRAQKRIKGAQVRPGHEPAN